MKRWLLAGGAAVIFFGLAAFVIILLAGRGGDAGTGTDGPYTRRELLIPAARMLLPDVEEELLNPGLQFAVDPDRPLDPDLLRGLESDLPQVLWEELLPRLQAEVEGLVFD